MKDNGTCIKLKCEQCGHVIYQESCGWCGMNNEYVPEIKKRLGRPKKVI